MFVLLTPKCLTSTKTTNKVQTAKAIKYIIPTIKKVSDFFLITNPTIMVMEIQNKKRNDASHFKCENKNTSIEVLLFVNQGAAS